MYTDADIKELNQELVNAFMEIEKLQADNKKLSDEVAALKRKYEKPLTWNLPKYSISNGTRKNANELYFDGMPGTGIIENLKTVLKMRWNSKKKCWYGFVSEQDINDVLTQYADEIPETKTVLDNETIETLLAFA